MNDTVITCTDTAEWESWLSAHHDHAKDVWVKIAKKGAASTTITLSEALDGALCYGWIDSVRRGYDANHYVQRYSPRRARSPWSQVNVAKVEALMAAGRMRAPGLAAVEAARADGRWEAAYASQREATIPEDLAAALDRDPAAREQFDSLDRTGQYALFLRLMKASTQVRRANQLRRIIEELSAQSNTSTVVPGCVSSSRT
ncbi:OmdA domain containing protein [Nocardia cyriacigeorgica]|uniref:OmdA domain containing protein n=1 Tax=Nocardia cyriacigeorgica TaxID=135487 RepID=A0A6P1DE29_9NOCA|nr:YdeI/OmpD-associated family protein [Nocardia cyriacigeorgica]NEW38717.1 OmdA domain containing protein [Nocardia cyriacigeorgica]NEW47891.1 OmdA domain containing protein [Nocardia cyriacigeorgica]NEW53875.1 OmdA domain containing protein [Nocardia cyriacigeorgica]NEW59299.1 OmdA domain containing protein [Nocardia cyriacigeorgica]